MGLRDENSQMSLVNVINLSHAFDGKDLFKGIGFQIEPGDRIGLVGPNGSGKTTILRLLNGFMEAMRGEIRMTRGIRIGYLPQDPRFYEHMIARETLRCSRYMGS